MSVFYTEYLQIRNSSMVYYAMPEYENLNKFKSNQTTFTKSNRNSQYSGQVKIGTQKRIRKALDLLLQISKNEVIHNPISGKNFNFRLSFITLTISSKEIQEHKFAYKNLLKPFLDWLTKTKGVTCYIWKAELQKRGQIHYHITTPNFVKYDEIRSKWNYLQAKNNLIEKGSTPPSTEIKSVRKINNIEHYLAKYIAKAVDENKALNCKVWDCSKNLKSNNYFTIEMNEKNAQMLCHNGIEDILVEEVYLDNCTILKSKEGYVEKLLKENLKEEYESWKKSIKENLNYIPAHKRNPSARKLTKQIEEFNRIEKQFEKIRNKAAVKKSTTNLFCVDN